LSKKRTAQALAELFGIPLSPGTVAPARTVRKTSPPTPPLNGSTTIKEVPHASANGAPERKVLPQLSAATATPETALSQRFGRDH